MRVLFLLLTLVVISKLDAQTSVPSWPPPVVQEQVLGVQDAAIPFLTQGMHFSLMGDMDNAVRALRAANKMSPSAPEPMIQLSLALCTLGEDAMAAIEAKRAEAAAQRLLPADPPNAVAGSPYVETLRERREGGGRCCRLPMLFPSSTVVQEDHNDYSEACRCALPPAPSPY